MPSPEFMQRVLAESAETLAAARGASPEEAEEIEAEEPEELEVEEPDEEVEEAEDEDEETPEAPEEAEEDESEEDAEEETDEDATASAQEDEEYYALRYRNREETERALREKDATTTKALQRAAELERKLAEYEKYVAYQQGLVEAGAGGEGDFEEWADRHIENDPQRGFIEAVRLSAQENDEAYAYAYADRWAESDPYRAAIARNDAANMLYAAAMERQQQPQQPENRLQPVPKEEMEQAIEVAWTTLQQENPSLTRHEAELRRIIEEDTRLYGAARSGDPEKAYLAISAANDRRMAARPGNGTPRLKASAAEQSRQDKLAATVSTGDGAPNKRTSTPEEFDPEIQGLMDYMAKRGQRKDLRD